MVHPELVAVLESNRHLADDGDHLVYLDGLALALLVDISEGAPFDPFTHDDEVQRPRRVRADDRLGCEDVEDGDDTTVVDVCRLSRRAFCCCGAVIGRGDEPQRDSALQRGIESLPQLDDTGLRDQHVQDVAADPPVTHPSRVRVSALSSPDEAARRRSTLRWMSATTSPTSWIRMAHAAAR